MKQPKRSISAVFLAVTMATALGCAGTATRESTGEFFDDAAITTKVKAAILNQPPLSVFEIKVDTFKGNVKLSGLVKSQANIDRAIEVARSVSGVKSVKNDMQLR